MNPGTPASALDFDRTRRLPYLTLRSANQARQAEWDPGDKITLAYRGNELGGEAGEAQNVIKKLERERLGIRGSRATVGDLGDELADVVICADLIAMAEGIDLDRAVAAKFNATSEKVGLATRLAVPGGEFPTRPDLAIAALEVALANGDNGDALMMAQVALDFLTGRYEPIESEVADYAAKLIAAHGLPKP